MQEYGSFYERYRDRIFAFLLRRSGDRELSEDLTQESFVRHLKRYGGSGASPYLLYTIARNALVDHRRARRTEVAISEEEVDGAGGDAESLFLAREEQRRMGVALGLLSERERQLLALAASGMRYARIASALGLSEANVKVLVHRARVRLRQLLDKGE